MIMEYCYKVAQKIPQMKNYYNLKTISNFTLKFTVLLQYSTVHVLTSLLFVFTYVHNTLKAIGVHHSERVSEIFCKGDGNSASD